MMIKSSPIYVYNCESKEATKFWCEHHDYEYLDEFDDFEAFALLNPVIKCRDLDETLDVVEELKCKSGKSYDVEYNILMEVE